VGREQQQSTHDNRPLCPSISAPQSRMTYIVPETTNNHIARRTCITVLYTAHCGFRSDLACEQPAFSLYGLTARLYNALIVHSNLPGHCVARQVQQHAHPGGESSTRARALLHSRPRRCSHGVPGGRLPAAALLPGPHLLHEGPPVRGRVRRRRHVQDPRVQAPGRVGFVCGMAPRLCALGSPAAESRLRPPSAWSQ
jgi:hypothetical protein